MDRTPPEDADPRSQAPAFEDWLDGFFASYFARRPVNATFVGLHDFDDRLPDLSGDGAGDTLADARALLTDLRALPVEALSPAQRIDRRLAEGYLKIQEWELQSRHFAGGNPSVYTGEAVFGILSLLLTDFAPLSERIESAIQRLEGVPALLDQCIERVRACPAQWTERAIRECGGARALLTDGVALLAAAHGGAASAFERKARVAATAFARLETHLAETLLSNRTEDYACGPEALNLYLQAGHCLDASPEDIEAYAHAEVERAAAELDRSAGGFGADTPAQALAGLADHHPTAEGYYARYQEIWDAVRALTRERELLTWPEFPIRYVPRPRWVRSAAPHLYFLFYRSPAAFSRPAVHDYLVTPIDASMPVDERTSLLRANNDSVIKLNHVIHHGSIGHHVQNWHAFRAPSRIGRMAAVDCASRIAMFCGGTMAEGWACYATDLMSEAGFLSPLEQYAELQSRRRMAARAVVDVRLHTGRFSLDQAARYYEREAGMPGDSARAEAVKNSMFPGAALMYLTGTDAIHDLRRTLSSRGGAQFSLRGFHDELLSYGSVPVPLIAEEMTRKADAAQR